MMEDVPLLFFFLLYKRVYYTSTYTTIIVYFSIPTLTKVNLTYIWIKYTVIDVSHAQTRELTGYY